MNYFYKIADIEFCIDILWQVKENKSFLPFMVDTISENAYHISFIKTNELPNEKGELLFQNNGFAIYKQEDGQLVKYFHNNMRDQNVYAYSNATHSDKKIIVYCLNEKYLHDIDGLFFHIGIENILLKENRIYFHSCCVDTEFGGILFSGVSGSGKSTQGSLWKESGIGKIINGDKTILVKDKHWIGYGSPYAGSSNIYLNEKCNIKAIVMLKKATACSIRKLNKAEAFRNIYSQIVINLWDETCIQKAIDFAGMLINELDIYEFSCTPDQNAVAFLKEKLQGEA